MGTKKKIEPKTEAAKKKTDKAESDRKVTRKSMIRVHSFSDAGIKHAVTPLG